MEVASVSEGKLKFQCIWCDVTLRFNEEHAFYWCPDCGGQWWPGPTNYGVGTLWKDEQRYKKSLSKPGGGGSSSGRKRSKPKKNAVPDRYPE